MVVARPTRRVHLERPRSGPRAVPRPWADAARGRAQARRSARRLAGRPVAALYSSDLRRALETAGPISSSLGLDVVVDARLRERNLGDLEGGPSERLVSALSGIAGGRVADADAAPEGWRVHSTTGRSGRRIPRRRWLKDPPFWQRRPGGARRNGVVPTRLAPRRGGARGHGLGTVATPRSLARASLALSPFGPGTEG